MKWKPITMPKEVVNDQSSATENYSRFIIEPLERGYGITLGNSLRRVLLSSIQGAAVVSMRITSCLHEFSTIKGVYEDVADIVLNVKNIIVRMHADEMRTLRLKIDKKALVVNQVKGTHLDGIQKAVDEFGMELSGVIPENEEIRGFDLMGKPTTQLELDNEAVTAAYQIFDKIVP